MVEMCCNMLADEVREKIGKGQEIDKPQSKSYFRLVNGGICYTIGNAGNEKSFTIAELYQMFKQIRDYGNADRRWFKQVMPRRDRQDPCNFTAMGAVLKYLGHAIYDRGVYRNPV